MIKALHIFLKMVLMALKYFGIGYYLENLIQVIKALFGFIWFSM
jgi:hypothetical protein